METFNIVPELIAEKITEKTKVILPISLFGLPANMSSINKIALDNRLVVLEDAAQSIGASYSGKKSGNLATIAATSFFPSKPLGAYGDGGAVIVRNNQKMAHKIRCLLNHGQTEKYHHSFIGINGRLDSMQAAVLSVKLKYLDDEVRRRNEIATKYLGNLAKDFYSFQKIAAHAYSAFAQFSLVAKKPRKKILDHLTRHEIPWSIYYPIPIHLQKAFEFLGYKTGDFPNCEKLAKTIFSIPIHPFLKTKKWKKSFLF